MGKIAKRLKRPTSKTGDPVVDQLAVVDAKNMLFSNLIGMGWRLAIMILVPIFIGVQIDKKFDTKPSYTMAAFFIAVSGASLLIYKTYVNMQREQLINELKKSKKNNRRANV